MPLVVNIMLSLKHEFSIYLATTTPLFQKIPIDNLVLLHDIHIYHRIVSILRLNKNDHCILFDQHINIRVLLHEVRKKEIVLKIVEKHSNKQLLPAITAWIPILKKDDMERAVYEVTAAGATIIQPLVTHKSRKMFESIKEHERLMRIIHTAAEQSKCYSFALLKEAKPIKIALQEISIDTTKIFAHPSGISSFDMITHLHIHHPTHITLLVGPEGDLTYEEKNLLLEKSFIFCRLTPTVLKAQQAITTLVSMVRSLISA
jgi:16S rRNA (uracil1498-N3)-methyltransferase